MKMKIGRLFFYVFCVVVAMGLTTTAVLALRGKCYKVVDKKIVYVDCDCPCRPKDRDSTGMYCKRCKHYMMPEDLSYSRQGSR